MLGLHGDDGYPYTVPVSFVYQEGGTGFGTIGFHCAKTGHKIDSIRRNNKVSFTVIDRDEVMPMERTTKFTSVIAFGQKGHPAMYEPVPEPEPELDEFDEDDEFYADKPPIEYAPFVEHFFDDEEEQQPSAEEDDDLPWFMR